MRGRETENGRLPLLLSQNLLTLGMVLGLPVLILTRALQVEPHMASHRSLCP